MADFRTLVSQLAPPWWRYYRWQDWHQDLVAGAIVALMLIPQGLAYAALAGVPPVYGLYASFLPLVCYALAGSSTVLSVGPMAITSLLTASALAPLGLSDPGQMVQAAGLLALISGGFLLLAGFLRMGALAQLLSHPVVNSFISGAALVIVISQLQPLLGLTLAGHTGIELLWVILGSLSHIEGLTAVMGCTALVLLLGVRHYGVVLFQCLGVPQNRAHWLQRLMPIMVLLLAAAVVYGAGWQERIAVVGALPEGRFQFELPPRLAGWWQQLWLPALIIGLLGFVENISIAQSFALKARQPLNANAELRALGLANLGSGLSSGFPVSGGFSRTLVNAEAGAKSPLSGVFAAGFVLLALGFARDLFAFLPMTVLAAMVIAAALQLIHVEPFRQAWRYDKAEAMAMAGTALGVLVLGVEQGIALGVALSLLTLVWRTSRPHIAVVGLVPGTEHFRNVDRHRVQTSNTLMMIRIDENLMFANAEAVFTQVMERVHAQAATQHLVLLMSSVSRIDVTALEMLMMLNDELREQQIALHFAEVKGPVSDQLQASELWKQCSGRLFLTGYQAYQALKD